MNENKFHGCRFGEIVLYYSAVSGAIIAVYLFHFKPVTSYYLARASAEVVLESSPLADPFRSSAIIALGATTTFVVLNVVASITATIAHRRIAWIFGTITVYLTMRLVGAIISWQVMSQSYGIIAPDV